MTIFGNAPTVGGAPGETGVRHTVVTRCREGPRRRQHRVDQMNQAIRGLNTRGRDGCIVELHAAGRMPTDRLAFGRPGLRGRATTSRYRYEIEPIP